MKIKKTIIIIILLLFLTFIIYQIVPFKLFPSRIAPDIVFDKKMIQRKENFLNKIQSKLQNQAPKKHPNIILLMADDLGKTDISLYGSKNLDTPNIDSIGKNGVTFTDAYCSSPICSPSRAGLLTGRNQQRFGFDKQPMTLYPANRFILNFTKYFLFDNNWIVSDSDDIIIPPEESMNKQGIPPSEILLSDIFQASGYETAIIGKWHLGHNDLFIPTNRGFNYHYGFYEAFSLYSPVDDPNIVNYRHKYFANRHIWSQERKGICAIRINDKPIEEKEYLTDKIASEAVKYIEKNKQKPFFLYVPFNAPHTPFQAKKSDYEKFEHVKDKNKRVYYSMILALDDAVGKILKKIKELNLENDTMIFFTSDNGGALYTEATENAPLRGGKMSQFEGGLNIPFMMSYGNKIKKGTVYKKPVSLLDIFATSTKPMKINLPDDRKYDGVDLIPYINGQKKEVPHEKLFWKSDYNLAIRKGNWKLLVDTKYNKKTLYHLPENNVEKVNLFKENPEKVKELLNDIKEWESELKPPLWPGFMNMRFVIDGDEFMFAI